MASESAALPAYEPDAKAIDRRARELIGRLRAAGACAAVVEDARSFAREVAAYELEREWKRQQRRKVDKS